MQELLITAKVNPDTIVSIPVAKQLQTNNIFNSDYHNVDYCV